MNLQMLNDEQVLDEGFRKRIIAEIESQENRDRKRRMAACWEIWRDQVRKFVLQRLADQGFQKETIAVMNQRASNINLFKKIVSKKARSYSKGVDRSVLKNGAKVEKATKDVEAVATAMDLTGAMKKGDRYRKAARNAMLYIYPEMVEDEEKPGEMVWTLCAKVFFPHLYDVIPDAKDKEKVRCLVLSPFTDDSDYASQPGLNGGDGRGVVSYSQPSWRRDGIDQAIADNPLDSGKGKKKEYIWWTGKYHLTTDENGVVIPAKTPEGSLNPIKRLPCVNLAEEQDGEFWALGGDDLVEATILINLKLTDMESILHMQGWGQLKITGQDLKKKDFAVGPQVALVLETDAKATHKTDAEILQHDPHTEEHLSSVEVHVALTLTTNNLSVKSVATNLEAGSVASAIAKMVDESENMDDISEDQEYYGKKEKEAFRIAESWLETLRPTKKLARALQETAPLPVSDIVTQYHNQEQVVTEAEKLTNLKLRKDLGIDTMIDLIKRDNPQMTDAQAEAKALQILNERAELAMKAQADAQKKGIEPAEDPQEEEAPDQEDPAEGEEEEEPEEEQTPSR